MSVKKTLAVPILALALVLAAGAPIMAKNAHSIDITSPAVLNGNRLDVGQYTIQWESHSPTATVTVWKGKKLVATTEGKLVDRRTRYKSNTFVFDANSDGTRVVREIGLAGSSQVLVFGDEVATPQAPKPQSSITPATPAGSSASAAQVQRVKFLGKPRAHPPRPIPDAGGDPLMNDLSLRLFQTHRPVSPPASDTQPTRAFRW
jgi:hypothetical protein